MNIRKLVNLYRQGSGADDYAGAELARMGDNARDELIRMLDEPRTSRHLAATILEILFLYFHSEESIQAMERFGARAGDERLRRMLQEMQDMMRANNRHKP
jgi:hypothetical protein